MANPPFAVIYTDTKPEGTDAANTLDSIIRIGTKLAIEERYALEHYALGSEELGASDSNSPNAQGRHIPGKVGVMFYGLYVDLPSDAGVGAIGYATDVNNFYINTSVGWQSFTMSSEHVIPDNTTLHWIPGSVDQLGMRHDRQQWVGNSAVAGVANVYEVDCNVSNSFNMTIGANSTLPNPLNTENGATTIFTIKQGGIGGFTMSFGDKFKFPGGIEPTLTPTVGAIDMIMCYHMDGYLLCTAAFDIRAV